jgi:hypothetical protein
MGVNNGMERMRMLREFIACTFAADPGKPDGSMDGTQRVGTKPGFFERGAAGLFHFGKRALDPYAKRCRASNAGPEQAPLCVFEACAATRAAAIDANEQRTTW